MNIRDGIKPHNAIRPQTRASSGPRALPLAGLAAFSMRVADRVLRRDSGIWRRFSLDYLEEGESGAAASSGDIYNQSLSLDVLFLLRSRIERAEARAADGDAANAFAARLLAAQCTVFERLFSRQIERAAALGILGTGGVRGADGVRGISGARSADGAFYADRVGSRAVVRDYAPEDMRGFDGARGLSGLRGGIGMPGMRGMAFLPLTETARRIYADKATQRTTARDYAGRTSVAHGTQGVSGIPGARGIAFLPLVDMAHHIYANEVSPTMTARDYTPENMRGTDGARGLSGLRGMAFLPLINMARRIYAARTNLTIVAPEYAGRTSVAQGTQGVSGIPGVRGMTFLPLTEMAHHIYTDKASPAIIAPGYPREYAHSIDDAKGLAGLRGGIGMSGMQSASVMRGMAFLPLIDTAHHIYANEVSPTMTARDYTPENMRGFDGARGLSGLRGRIGVSGMRGMAFLPLIDMSHRIYADRANPAIIAPGYMRGLSGDRGLSDAQGEAAGRGMPGMRGIAFLPPIDMARRIYADRTNLEIIAPEYAGRSSVAQGTQGVSGIPGVRGMAFLPLTEMAHHIYAEKTNPTIIAPEYSPEHMRGIDGAKSLVGLRGGIGMSTMRGMMFMPLTETAYRIYADRTNPEIITPGYMRGLSGARGEAAGRGMPGMRGMAFLPSIDMTRRIYADRANPAVAARDYAGKTSVAQGTQGVSGIPGVRGTSGMPVMRGMAFLPLTEMARRIYADRANPAIIAPGYSPEHMRGIDGARGLSGLRGRIGVSGMRGMAFLPLIDMSRRIYANEASPTVTARDYSPENIHGFDDARGLAGLRGRIGMPGMQSASVMRGMAFLPLIDMAHRIYANEVSSTMTARDYTPENIHGFDGARGLSGLRGRIGMPGMQNASVMRGMAFLPLIDMARRIYADRANPVVAAHDYTPENMRGFDGARGLSGLRGGIGMSGMRSAFVMRGMAFLPLTEMARRIYADRANPAIIAPGYSPEHMRGIDGARGLSGLRGRIGVFDMRGMAFLPLTDMAHRINANEAISTVTAHEYTGRTSITRGKQGTTGIPGIRGIPGASVMRGMAFLPLIEMAHHIYANEVNPATNAPEQTRSMIGKRDAQGASVMRGMTFLPSLEIAHRIYSDKANPTISAPEQTRSMIGKQDAQGVSVMRGMTFLPLIEMAHHIYANEVNPVTNAPEQTRRMIGKQDAQGVSVMRGMAFLPLIGMAHRIHSDKANPTISAPEQTHSMIGNRDAQGVPAMRGMAFLPLIDIAHRIHSDKDNPAISAPEQTRSMIDKRDAQGMPAMRGMAFLPLIDMAHRIHSDKANPTISAPEQTRSMIGKRDAQGMPAMRGMAFLPLIDMAHRIFADEPNPATTAPEHARGTRGTPDAQSASGTIAAAIVPPRRMALSHPITNVASAADTRPAYARAASFAEAILRRDARSLSRIGRAKGRLSVRDADAAPRRWTHVSGILTNPAEIVMFVPPAQMDAYGAGPARVGNLSWETPAGESAQMRRARAAAQTDWAGIERTAYRYRPPEMAMRERAAPNAQADAAPRPRSINQQMRAAVRARREETPRELSGSEINRIAGQVYDRLERRIRSEFRRSGR